MRGRNRPVRSAVWSPPRGAVYTPGNANALFGMWFDGVDDAVIFSGLPYAAKTKGRITGSFQTTSAAVECICAGTDSSDAASDLRVNVNAGKLFFGVREGATTLAVATDATFNDGAAHTFEVEVTAAGNSISVDGTPQAVTYSAGDASSSNWFSTVADMDAWAIGVRQESTPDNFFEQWIGDISIYDEDGATLLGRWLGTGPTNADWTDQAGSNDGTVAGSPNKATSTDGGKTWGELT